MSRNILVASATQKSNEEDTILKKSINFLDLDIDVVFALENKRSLANVYNGFIDYALNEGYDSLVLVHDDVWIEHDFKEKLENLFKTFDIVGVAGPAEIKLEEPALWHIMGGGFQSGKLRGAVNHYINGFVDENSPKYMSSFGPIPSRTIMIDGVFMAINLETCRERFDETNPSKFHFYDLDFSISCHKKGLKVGVGDIYITHASPGLREYTTEWLEGQKYFFNKHQ